MRNSLAFNWWSNIVFSLIMDIKGWCNIKSDMFLRCVISVHWWHLQINTFSCVCISRKKWQTNETPASNTYAFWSVSINYTEWLVGPKWFPVDVCECLRMIITHLWKSHFHLCDWRLWLHCHLVHENIW